MADQSYTIKVGVIGDRDLARFQSSIDRMNRSARNSQSALNSMQKGFNNVGRALKTLAPLMVSAFSVRAVKGIIETADAIAKVADATGLTIEGYQELEFAAGRSGVATSKFNSNMTAFVKRVGEAKNGMGPLVSGLRNMNSGLLESLQNSKSQEQALGLLADAIQNAESATEAAAIANAAFGRSGVEMVNMLRDGSAGLSDYAKKARELGLVYEQDLVRAAEEYNDALSDLERRFQATFGRAVLTGITSFVNEVDNMMISLFAGIDKLLVGAETLWKVTWLTIQSAMERTLAAILTPLQKTLEWMGKFSDTAAGMASSMPTLASASADYAAELRKLGDEHARQVEIIDRTAQGMINQNVAMRESRAAAREAAKSYNQLNNAAGDTAASADELNKALQASNEELNKCGEAANKAANELSDYDREVQNFEDSINRQVLVLQTVGDKIDVLNRLYREGKVTTEIYEAEMKKLNETLGQTDAAFSKVQDSMDKTGKEKDKLRDNVIDFSRIVEDALGTVVVDAAKSMVDAMFEGGKTIGEILEDMVKSFARLVAEVLATEAAMWALDKVFGALGKSSSGMFGGGGGGGMGGGGGFGAVAGAIGGNIMFPGVGGIIGGAIGGLLPFARGGVVPANMLTAMNGGFVTRGPMKIGFGPLTPAARGMLIGEAGQEAVMPLKRGPSGRLGVESTGGNVAINVHNYSGANVKAINKSRVDGGREIDFYISDMVKKEIRRGGFDRPFKTNFNIPRRGL